MLRNFMLIFFLLYSSFIRAAITDPLYQEMLSIDLYDGSAIVEVFFEKNPRYDNITLEKYDKYKDELDVINERVALNNSNEFQITGEGHYHIRFYRDSLIDTEVYSQSVYIPGPTASVAEELAKQYLPIVVFNENEEYFPMSLENILSFTHNQSQFNDIRISGGVFGNNQLLQTGPDLKYYMNFNGGSNHYFNMESKETTYTQEQCDSSSFCSEPLFLRYATGDATGSKDRPVIYWDSTIEGTELALTYWFFYPFDPKLGTSLNPDGAAHAFDRESFTILFSNEAGEYIPQTVTYAGHLDSQDIRFKTVEDGDDLVEWTGGKTTIDWANVKKVGQHPVIYKARGAHAIYPTSGYYGVQTAQYEGLTEPAGLGDGHFVLPDVGISNVQLEKLDYQQLSYLGFSGDWVDVKVISNAKFPPFTRLPYTSWVNKDYGTPTVILGSNVQFDFDSCFAITDNLDVCNPVRESFSSIDGIGDFKAITVKVIDEATNEVMPNSEIILRSENGQFELSRLTHTNGIRTLFFEPIENQNYSVSVNTSEYGEVECLTIDSSSLVEALLNNKPTQECYVSGGLIQGSIEGSIKDVVTSVPVVNASVAISQSGQAVETVFSDESGFYDARLEVGEYKLDISAEGYIPAEVFVNVQEEQTLTVTELQQISEDYAGEGVASGFVTDATSNAQLADVLLEVRSGVDAQTGTIINSTTTGQDGNYSLTLEAGNYTVEASKNGYVNGYFNIYVLGDQNEQNQNFAISPTTQSADSLRVVLSWKEQPLDLDSHLFTPVIEGNEYHIYYGARGSESSAPYAQLDLDNTDIVNDSRPETISLSRSFEGTYTYSVYNYSGDPDIKTSQGKVEVYDGSDLLRTYNIPLSGEGRWWNVFSYDGLSGDISSINQISDTSH